MALPPQQITQGLLDELERFEDLVRSLTPEQMNTPSRCEGWSVGDVAGHVIGQMTDVAQLRLDGLGTPEVTERQVVERRGRSAAELADELEGTLKSSSDLLAAFDEDAWNAPSPGGFDFTLAEGVEALWSDAWVHGDDIRSAIGKQSEDGTGVDGALSHIAFILTQQEYPAATIAVDGHQEFAVSGGGGNRIEGDPVAFALAATGRGNPDAFGLDETINIYR